MILNRFFSLSFAALISVSLSAGAQNSSSSDLVSVRKSKAETLALPALQADSKQVSVSGISAGAFMATQLQVAFSSSIMGVGSVAGGPWYCAKNSMISAQLDCMYMTSNIEPKALISEARTQARKNHLDPLVGLKTARVYLYNSKQDGVVHDPINAKTVDFFSAFVAKENIASETSIPSAHGFPTLDYGIACDSQGAPYLNKCGYDTAGEMLKHFYPSRAMTRGQQDSSSLHVFDQTEFGAEAALMDKTGWVYIPKACEQAGSNCPVHVALHGCLQAGEAIKDVFAVHAGYNEWAEGSNIIVIYPQTMQSSDNPNACFDWWGYTGPDYANREGTQMKVIKAMMDRVLSAKGS
jgi:poly(3-hydroxybutyrate) depolymerase